MEETKNPRLLQKGDFVRVKSNFDADGMIVDVVRRVEVLAHLANGQAIPLSVDEDVTIIPPEDLPEEVVREVRRMGLEGS